MPVNDFIEVFRVKKVYHNYCRGVAFQYWGKTEGLILPGRVIYERSDLLEQNKAGNRIVCEHCGDFIRNPSDELAPEK